MRLPSQTWWAIGQPATITMPTITCTFCDLPSRL